MKDFTKFVDLASERVGGRVLEANDEFFAPRANLLKQTNPIYREGKYTPRGKWMDGWETRRRRTPGHDWCIIRLGLPGVIRGVVVDTSYFKGNYPERFSLEGCDLGGGLPYREERSRLKASETHWIELLRETALRGDSQNMFSVEQEGRLTHVRLRIYPDGGVARLRVYGEVVPGKARNPLREIDLAALENGGRVIASSDQFFGDPLNLLVPGPARNMGDGWETRRRRGPGHDWVIVQLGAPGEIRRVEVDTSHFKGNFPESCSLEACYAGATASDPAAGTSNMWKQLLPMTRLKANHRHMFREEIRDVGCTTNVRFNIYPDGGVARLRLFGRAQGREDRPTGAWRFHQLSEAQARKALLDCCGSKKWTARMLKQRPFPSVDRLLAAADETWAELERKDWLEAFRHHPAIGSRRPKQKQSAASRRWSAREQSVAQKAPPETLERLAAANQAYQAAFGHVFLICAAGKTGEEILENLQQRLSNAPDLELRVAAEEQRKITRLRLEKLLAP
jgi:allantoicase